MISIQEMTAWTSRDIEAAIHAALPRGWRFTLEVDRGLFSTSFTDAEGNTVSAREGLDERLILFDAYGWLQRCKQPVLSEVWNPKRGVPRRPRHGQLSLTGIRIPDPQDLDPAEIEMVYREHLSRRK